MAKKEGIMGNSGKRKQVEVHFRRGEDICRAIAEAAQDAIYIISSEGRIEYINGFGATLFGLQPGKVIGKKLEALFPPNISEQLKKKLKKVFETNQPIYSEDKIIFPKGVIWMHTSLVPMLDETGNVAGVMGISRDVTEYKRLEEELRLLQILVQDINLADSFNSAIDVTLRKICEATGWVMGEAWIPSSDGSHLGCSPVWYGNGSIEPLEKFRKISEGFRFQPGIGLPGRAWLSKKSVWDTNVTLDSNFPRGIYAVEAGLKGAMAIPVLSGDKVVAVLDFFVMEPRTEDKRLVDLVSTVAAYLGVLFQRKEAEEELRKLPHLEEQLLHSQKLEAIGRLVGGIAHDFNNILTGIIGFAGIMQMNLRKDDPFKDHVEQILEAAGRGASLTQSLLIFGRKQVIHLAPVNLNEIIGKVDKLLSRLIGEDIELRVAISKNDLMIMADSVQIEQILMNLATNARDAMPGGGVLTIETGREKLDNEFITMHGYGEAGAYALISVSDTGLGMDEKTRNNIFEPFFTTKEAGKGTGLGLSIVYGIVKQHNGYINVYSEVGKGTTFKIYLPLVKMKAGEIKPEGPVVSVTGTETVLIGEDDATVRKLSKTLLETFGYKVIEAVDGEDAVEKFMENKGKIQLVILDVIMPKKNGKEAYDQIRKAEPGIKALFMSGYTADDTKKRGILEEGLDFVSKPISPSAFLRKVREVLDK